MPTCWFCKTEVGDVEGAVEAGWVPTFYIDQDTDSFRESGESVCSECVVKHLHFDLTGELVINADECYEGPVWGSEGWTKELGGGSTLWSCGERFGAWLKKAWGI